MNIDEGATPEPEKSLMECPGDNSGQFFKHAWIWVWNGPVWTNTVQCQTCGKIEERK